MRMLIGALVRGVVCAFIGWVMASIACIPLEWVGLHLFDVVPNKYWFGGVQVYRATELGFTILACGIGLGFISGVYNFYEEESRRRKRDELDGRERLKQELKAEILKEMENERKARG